MAVSSEKMHAIFSDLVESMTLVESLKKQGVNRDSFYKTLEKNIEYSEAYSRARNFSTEVMFDELKTIADDQSLDPNRARNMIGVRQWMMAKLKPNKYGERIDVNHTGTVDIKGVLAEIDGRMKPMRNLIDLEDAQIVETKEQLSIEANGLKPDDAPNVPDNSQFEDLLK